MISGDLNIDLSKMNDQSTFFMIFDKVSIAFTASRYVP